jgi:acetylornithine deacetylase
MGETVQATTARTRHGQPGDACCYYHAATTCHRQRKTSCRFLNPDLLDRIRQLIAIPSVSSVSPQFDQSNRPVIDLLAGWLEDAGFAVRIEPLPERPDKANLIATLGVGQAGWCWPGTPTPCRSTPGAGVTIRSAGRSRTERIYGLGAADMKAFLALALEAARDFTARDLRQPLVILATADEESSMMARGRWRRRAGRWVGTP